MKTSSIVVAAIILTFLGIAFFSSSHQQSRLLSPLIGSSLTEKPKNTGPLAKYNFDNLSKEVFPGSEIELKKIIKKERNYTSWLFSYQTEGKTVSGMANIPKDNGPFPVIVMVRGWADQEIYFTGLGTRKAAGVFADNGFITLAPDFLGFGVSDQSSADILEARFERPVTVLSLIASIKYLKSADPEKIFLWGHSNGGQIALSVLEITNKAYPTTLWAPVTQSFPESILTYIDPSQVSTDSQKVIDSVDSFKKEYDPALYSITSFLDRIKAPIQIHQGGADPLVPKEWQEKIISELEKSGNKPAYFYYPKSDHNLKEDWDLVVERDLKFFREASSF